MSDQRDGDSQEAFEKASEDSQNARYVLRLYVSGNTPKSALAILNLHEVIDTRLEDRYELEVIDIYQQPERAKTDQILATPTLVKSLPLPVRKIIGDLSEVHRVLVGLNLVEKKK